MTILHLVPPPKSPLGLALELAAAEHIEANVMRWLAFHGWAEGEPIELQALDVPTGRIDFQVSKVAHATTPADVVRLCVEAEGWKCPAVYFIANEVNPSVAARAEANVWHTAKKGTSTTDAEIRSRRVLFVDVDARRPSGISATDAEVALTVEVAERIHARFARVLGGETALALGHSGNGRSVLVALDSVPNTPEVTATIKGILAALGAIYNRPQEVEIDASVCDPKRLLPAWGTTKRKGVAGHETRHHRATGLIHWPTITRKPATALDLLLADLLTELSVEQRAAVDKARGLRPAPTTQPTRPQTPGFGERLYDKANDVPIRDVVARCNLLDGDAPTCAGCGTSGNGDTSVAFVGNGVKCLHARCANQAKSGFYTAVDFVIASQRLTPTEAVNQIAEWFGFDGLKPKREQRTPGPVEGPPEGWVDPALELADTEAEEPAQSAVIKYKVRTIGDLLTGVYSRAQSPETSHGMPSGIATIDKVIGGFRRGRVTVLGASTSWGKSSFALLASDSAIKAGGRVLLVSGEDNEDAYGQRLMAMRAQVNALSLRGGASQLSDEDWLRMTAVLSTAESSPFFLDGIGQDAETLAKAIGEIAASEKPDLVIVDYLQAFSCAKRCQDRRNEITHIARCFTDAIKVAGSAGLIFSQLKRLDPNVTPTMHDLKESGDVENMAEHVLIGYGVKETSDANFSTWKRFLIVAKNKDGPRPAEPLELDFNGDTASFVPQNDERLERTGRPVQRQQRTRYAKKQTPPEGSDDWRDR